MECGNRSQHHGCGHGECFDPVLWSKKRKLEFLHQRLECLKEQESDVLEAIKEIEKT